METEKLLSIFPTRGELDNYKVTIQNITGGLEKRIATLEEKLNEYEKSKSNKTTTKKEKE
jgi:hypothetical protein